MRERIRAAVASIVLYVGAWHLLKPVFSKRLAGLEKLHCRFINDPIKYSPRSILYNCCPNHCPRFPVTQLCLSNIPVLPYYLILTCRNENIDISGPVTITNNTALFGGAIWTEATKLTLPSDADISSNTAIVEVSCSPHACQNTTLGCFGLHGFTAGGETSYYRWHKR